MVLLGCSRDAHVWDRTSRFGVAEATSHSSITARARRDSPSLASSRSARAEFPSICWFLAHLFTWGEVDKCAKNDGQCAGAVGLAVRPATDQIPRRVDPDFGLPRSRTRCHVARV